MKIAIITPYYKETNEQLQRCHDSVINQTHDDVTHIVISDGYPNDIVDSWDRTIHIKLPHSGDPGDTPRAVGGVIAHSLNFDGLSSLDADNWLELDHVETMVNVHKKYNVDIVTATRNLIRMDGTFLAVCTESNGREFNDTNCIFLSRSAFYLMSSWAYKKNLKDGLIGDRIFWSAVVNSGKTRAHMPKPTVNYVTSFACHYQQNNEPPPKGSKVIYRLPDKDYSEVASYEDYVKIINEFNLKNRR